MYSTGQIVMCKKTQKPVAWLGMYEVKPPPDSDKKYAFDTFYFSSEGVLPSKDVGGTTHIVPTEAGLEVPEVMEYTSCHKKDTPYQYYIFAPFLPDTEDEAECTEFMLKITDEIESFLKKGYIDFEGRKIQMRFYPKGVSPVRVYEIDGTMVVSTIFVEDVWKVLGYDFYETLSRVDDSTPRQFEKKWQALIFHYYSIVKFWLIGGDNEN